ncbi:hypothetical protein BHM03_00011133 [Ensete ventricosum]|nr:hypothetical protein BHM03_00011133 [Ensete ventricosum]
MSLHLHIVCATSFPCSSLSTFRRIASFEHHGHHPCLSPRIRCSGQPLLRRSANYQPNLWTHDYIESLTNDHSVDTIHLFMKEEQNAARISNLEEEVVKLIQEEKELEDQLQLIDHLQQLGVAYHFKDDIKDALGSIHGSQEDKSMLLKDNLHATALLFRLLRENGFDVSEGSSPHLHYACLIKRSAEARPRYNHRPSTPSVRLGRSTEAQLRYNPQPSTPSTTLGWLGSTVLKQETTPAMIPMVLFYGGEGSFLMVIGGVAISGGVVTPTTEPTPAPASESPVGVEVPQRLPLATLIGPLVRGPDPTTVVSLGPLPGPTLEPYEEVASRHLASPL